MIGIRGFIIATLLCTGQATFAQVPAAAPFPKLAGVWAPSEPERSDKLFGVGLTAVPGAGRLTIEQRADRLTVSITMPDDKLDPLLSINGRFFTTIIYRLSEARWVPVAAGAGGSQLPTIPTWFGDSLVIPDARPGPHPITVTYSLDGDRLKVETKATNGEARANTTEWFTRIK